MTGRRCLLLLLALPVFVLAAMSGASPSKAAESVLLVMSRDILSVAPKLDERSLVGRTVWIGDSQGLRGTAMVEPKPDHRRDAVLDHDFGVELGLAFTGQTAFVAIAAKKLAPGPISKLVLMRANELGAVDSERIELVELARVDLNGDDVPEILISAHTVRDPSDPYLGKAGDIESIFVVTRPDDEPKILDQIAMVLNAEEAKSGRPHISLAALGQNPVTRSWTLLLSQHLERWEDETSTLTVTVDGQTTQQTTAQRGLSKTTLAAGYTLAKEKLTPVQGLSYRLLSF